MRERKINYGGCIISILFGMVILTGGILYAKYFYDFKQNAEEVTAEITRIEEDRNVNGDLEYRAYVSYTYDGTDYEDVYLDFFSNSMREGDKITLFCDPKEPEEVMGKSWGGFVSLILIGLGAVFVLVGLIFAIVKIRERKPEE